MKVDCHSLHPAHVVHRPPVRRERVRDEQQLHLPELLIVRPDLSEYAAPLVTFSCLSRCHAHPVAAVRIDDEGLNAFEKSPGIPWRAQKSGYAILDERAAAGGRAEE